MTGTRHAGLLLRFFCAVLISLCALGVVRGAPVVNMRFSLHEVDLNETDKKDPDTFDARFIITFEWNPAEAPDFDPRKIKFWNAESSIDVEPVMNAGLRPDPNMKAGDKAGSVSQDAGMKTCSLLMTGEFRAYAQYTGFPFDRHSLPLILYYPGIADGGIVWSSVSGGVGARKQELRRFDGWIIKNVAFHPSLAGYLHTVPSTNGTTPDAACIVTVDVARDTISALAFYFVPILVIWAIAYSGFFWEESSPASRCGTAAMFSAVSFYVGSSNWSPAVDYLTFLEYVFIGLYLNIAVCFLFVTTLFWHRSQKRPEHSRLVWRIGVVACPVLAVTTLCLCLFLSSHRAVENAVFDPQTSEQAGN